MPAAKIAAISNAAAPIRRFLLRMGFHPIQIGHEGVDRVRPNLHAAVPATLKNGQIPAEYFGKLRGRTRAAAELPLIIAIRFGAMNANQLLLAKVGETGQVEST